MRSAKSKGRGFQKFVATKIRETFGLEERDVCSSPASVTGEDIILSERAKKVFPYSVEAKCSEQLNIWKAIEQSKSNSKGKEPLVIFKKNFNEPYVCIKLDSFLKLIKRC